MKRLMAMILALALLLSVCGCSDDTPEGLSKGTFKQGKAALEVMDAYLAGETAAEDTLVKLEEVAVALEADGAALEAKLRDASGSKYGELMNQSMNCAVITMMVVAFASDVEEAPDAPEGTNCQRARDEVAKLVVVAEE